MKTPFPSKNWLGNSGNWFCVEKKHDCDTSILIILYAPFFISPHS